MSISVCETIGNGRDGLLPLLSCETWMLVKEYPDRKKKEKSIFQKYQEAEIISEITPAREYHKELICSILSP